MQFSDIAEFVADGARMRSGETLAADLIVLATGYKGQEQLVAQAVRRRGRRPRRPDLGIRRRPGVAQHVHAHRAAGPLVHRRQPRAVPHLLEVPGLQIKAIEEGLLPRGCRQRLLRGEQWREFIICHSGAMRSIEPQMRNCAPAVWSFGPSRNDNNNRGNTHADHSRFGEHRYRVVENWAKLPDGWNLTDVASVAVDSKDRIYVFNRGAHPMVVLRPRRQFHQELGRRPVRPRAWPAHRRR